MAGPAVCTVVSTAADAAADAEAAIWTSVVAGAVALLLVPLLVGALAGVSAGGTIDLWLKDCHCGGCGGSRRSNALRPVPWPICPTLEGNVAPSFDGCHEMSLALFVATCG